MQKLKSIEVKLIAAFLLVAGRWGFLAFLYRLFALDSGFEMILHLFAAGLFGLTTYSGFLLLKENEKGLEIGRAIVAMQIVNFHIAGLGYSFITGAYLFFGISNARFGFDFGLDTGFLIELADESTNFVLRLNILAVAVFVYLSRTLNRVQEEQDIQEELDRSKENANGPQHDV
jgi:hypothetical protein